MDVLLQLAIRAKECRKRIVLPEGDDPRILVAADTAGQESLAYPILVGNVRSIQEKASQIGVKLEGVRIVDPNDSPDLDRYAALYHEMRSKERVSESIASRIVKRNLYFGAMMLRAGDADGMVAGAVSPTASVVRAGTLTVGLQADVSQPSSFVLVDIAGFRGGENGACIFADTAVNPDPDPDQLAEITAVSARTARALLEWEPRVAMLSFSTRGSAHHRMTAQVLKATETARKRAPDLLIDGELQADAALVPEIGRRKVKDESPVAGRANVLIFPDLNAANIAYKLVQHVTGAMVYGPILQGFAKPISDLSRGSSVNDILGTIIIVGVEAQSRY